VRFDDVADLAGAGGEVLEDAALAENVIRVGQAA
jgi:hypothetical protein